MTSGRIIFIVKLIPVLIFGVSALIPFVLGAQNIVIKNGQFNEGYDRENVTDITLGNPCNIPNFTVLFYNGTLNLKGDMNLNDAILTVYGNLNQHGYNITYNCERSELIIENTLGINSIIEESFKLFPNPTSGLFYVSTRKKYGVKVYDMKGRHLTNLPDLREFPSGIYLVEVNIKNNKNYKKIIKV